MKPTAPFRSTLSKLAPTLPWLISFSLDRMAAHASSVILLLVGMAATADAAEAVTLRSQRRNITVAVTDPRGWRGPSHQVWPSYDTFTFTDDHKPTAWLP